MWRWLFVLLPPPHCKNAILNDEIHTAPVGRPQDEDSQTILSLLQCTNSRHGVSTSVGGGGGAGGDYAASTSSDASATGTKRRGRDQYSGELNAQEVANGFGMGMSSKVRGEALCDIEWDGVWNHHRQAEACRWWIGFHVL